MKRFLFFCFFLTSTIGINAEETITVTVSGYGATPEAAEKSALQKAVRKAVGEMVDAETLAQNGELIKDEVLSYSDGFVQSMTTLSGPEKDEDLGFFSITIEAKVLPKKLAAKLEDAKITTSAVAGKDIWAQAVSKISNVFEGRDMLAKLVNEEIVPARLLKTRLISPGPDGKPLYDDQAKIEQKIDYDAETVEMTYMVEMRWDREAYLESIVPRMTALLDKLAVAPPVEVRGPLYKTKSRIYPNGEFRYAHLSTDVKPENRYKNRESLVDLNECLRIYSKEGLDSNGKYSFSYPYFYNGQEFKAVWSKEHFLVLVDTSTKEDEFAVKVYTLKGDEYYKVFYQNNQYHGWSWSQDKEAYIPEKNGNHTRPSVFPYLVFEVADENGNPIGSRLIEKYYDKCLVMEYNPVPASSLLAKLNQNKEIKTDNVDMSKQSREWDNFGETKFTKYDPYPPSGVDRYTGFFDPIGIWDNGNTGAANLTMPKFFFDDQKGMSNSNVITIKLTIPYKDTKRIKKVNLFWLDDSYMNSRFTTGSLIPNDDPHDSYSEEALLSGKTGLSFKYSENDLLVDQVAPNSPADSTGKIAPGDIVLGFANPADLDEQSSDGPIHWDPFKKLDKKNAKENFSQYFWDFASNIGMNFWGTTVIKQINDALKEDAAPLELVTDLLTSGPPDTFVYLLIRPKANPNERVIVPIRRKVL
jgi:hypothetical protein